MLKHDRRWAYSLEQSSDGWETYKTREDAIAAGYEEVMANGGDSTFYVGECEFYEPKVDGRRVIDWILDDVGSSSWAECSELWLDGITVDEERLLGRMLTETLHEWLMRTGNAPDFSVCDFRDEVLPLG